MANKMELVKSAKFGTIPCDFYGKDDKVYMTINQLAECLGYSSKSGVENIINRNKYLKTTDFSSTHKLWVDGKQRATRVFTEDGIYEVAFLAKTQNAKEFRSWVRKILKSLRKGESKIVSMTEYQRMMVETRAENAKIRKAQILERLAKEYDGTYKQVLQSYATYELTGEHLLPLPSLPEKTLTATEIGDRLGISANKVGILANRYGLKTEKYGAWFNDKAKHCSKEVQSFRYYEEVIPVLRNILHENEAM